MRVQPEQPQSAEQNELLRKQLEERLLKVQRSVGSLFGQQQWIENEFPKYVRKEVEERGEDGQKKIRVLEVQDKPQTAYRDVVGALLSPVENYLKFWREDRALSPKFIEQAKRNLDLLEAYLMRFDTDEEFQDGELTEHGIFPALTKQLKDNPGPEGFGVSYVKRVLALRRETDPPYIS